MIHPTRIAAAIRDLETEADHLEAIGATDDAYAMFTGIRPSERAAHLRSMAAGLGRHG